MVRSLRLGIRRATPRAELARITHEEIARVAYELFEKRGKSHGNDQRDWFEAEHILHTRRQSGNGR